MTLQKWSRLILLVVIAIAAVILISPQRLSTSIFSPRSQASPQGIEMSPAPPPQVSSEQLMGHVEALAYERYTDSDRQRARDYLTQVLQSVGWSPTTQSFNTGINIVAQRPGTDPEAGNILVAAHYDSVENSPGADDNASGVAVVLEVARLLGDRPTPRTLQIALFDQEEAGLVGSYAYAEQAANLEDLQGVIVLEMLGYACHTVGCQRRPKNLQVELPSDRGDFIAVVGDAEHPPLLQAFKQTHQPAQLPLLTLSVPFKGVLTPILLLSDHTPFWFQDVGAVMVTDTAFLRNPHYHQPSDTPSTLDSEFFSATAQMVVSTTTALLESRSSLTENAPNS